ncbi:sporulation protein [Bacillus sp. REN3]|uniref:sporulation protein n=1 Tax=Bacillus sp. REN3 TaxID=2802440 RepID=UPI001AEE67F8|nr:sporulation protein [Bacillus sp. REN3]
MLLRKYMSLMGVGSAQIDLILKKDVYKPGEAVTGYFLIKGGTIDQELKQIDCDLVLLDEKSGAEEIIDTARIQIETRIRSEGADKVPFSFQLPEDVPVSTRNLSYRFKTKLTFEQGVESWDEDMIRVVH